MTTEHPLYIIVLLQYLGVKIVYYESIKREPKIRGIYECRCDERLQTKTEEFTRPPIHWKGVPVGVPHPQSENTIVHASIIRNEKNSVPPSESIPSSEFFRNGVVFFR